MRPMKAPVCEDDFLEKLRLPMFASVKYDGLRSVNKDGNQLSSSLKPIRNTYVRRSTSFQRLHGLDGELLIAWGGPGQPPFGEVSSAITSEAGTPDFIFWVFDLWHLDLPFILRYDNLKRKVRSLSDDFPFIRLVPQVLCETVDEIREYETWALEQGYEGIMLRSHDGKYKFGESTLKEQYLLKRKPFVDDEAYIIGFVEEQENTNEATLDNFGHIKRSSAKDGMVGKDTLGKFIVQSKKWGKFAIGKGQMTHAKAKDIWDNREQYLGKIAVFKYQNFSIKDKPRLPIFKAIRHPDDLTPDKLEAI